MKENLGGMQEKDKRKRDKLRKKERKKDIGQKNIGPHPICRIYNLYCK